MDPTQGSDEYKRCPYCAEQILAAAIKCKHCRSDIPMGAAIGRDVAQPGSSIYLRQRVSGQFVGFVIMAALVWTGWRLWHTESPAPAALPAAIVAGTADAVQIKPAAVRRAEAAAKPAATSSSSSSGEHADYSKPLYTKRYATVCPLGIMFDRHAQDQALDAASTFFSHEEALSRAGCEEWHGGYRIYIAVADGNLLWQPFSESNGTEPRQVILGWDVSNDPVGGP